MESNDLFVLADELRELKETKKRLEDELKAVGQEIDRVDNRSCSAHGGYRNTELHPQWHDVLFDKHHARFGDSRTQG